LVDGCKLFDTKEHQLALSTFEIGLQPAPELCFKRSSGNVLLCQLGDAALTPHFMTRSGVVYGFKSLRVMDNVVEGSMSLDQANIKMKDLQFELGSKAWGTGFADANKLCPICWSHDQTPITVPSDSLSRSL
jgi:hypothetical protein